MSDTPILEDYLELITYGFTNPMPDSDEGPWKITAKDVINGEINFNTARKTTLEAFQTKLTKKSRPKIGDVLLTKDGTLGRLAIVQQENICINQSVAVLRPNEKILPDYLFYLLSTPQYQSKMIGDSDGTVIKHIYITRVGKMEVDIPSIQEQQVRLKHLLAIDKKITLNRKTNQTLEQLAQAIFKSWFVDFDPVKAKIQANENGQDSERAAMCVISGKADDELDQLNPETLQQLKDTAALFPDALVESELGEIPEGWSVSCVDDVCEFQNGFAFKSKEMSKSPENTYKVFKMGGIKKGGGLNKSSTKDYYEKNKCEKLGRYLIKKGDLLMCMTDMKNNVALLGHTALMDVDNVYILNQRVGLLRSKNVKQANYPFLYILTNSKAFIEDLRSRANSGVQVNLSTKEIKETKFILPTENVHIAFDQIVERSREQIFSIEAEQNYLSKIRDVLLPKLLSGELSPQPQDEVA